MPTRFKHPDQHRFVRPKASSAASEEETPGGRSRFTNPQDRGRTCRDRRAETAGSQEQVGPRRRTQTHRHRRDRLGTSERDTAHNDKQQRPDQNGEAGVRSRCSSLLHKSSRSAAETSSGSGQAPATSDGVTGNGVSGLGIVVGVCIRSRVGLTAFFSVLSGSLLLAPLYRLYTRVGFGCGCGLTGRRVMLRSSLTATGAGRISLACLSRARATGEEQTSSVS